MTDSALCHPCPLLQLCGAAADEDGERWGVWAGVDRSVSPKRKHAADA